MSGVAQQLRALGDAQKLRRIEVPELPDADGKPLSIYYRMITLEDLATIHELDGSNWQKQSPRLVVMKACDADGKLLFAPGDVVTLREEAPPEIVNRIALAMLGRVSLEDAEKN